MKTAYFGNPWLGMFIKTNDEVTMLPSDSMQKVEDMLKGRLETETIRTNIADCNLVGMYTAMNSNGVVLPNVVRDEEVVSLKKAGLNVYVCKDKHNANGNNLAVNDKGGIVNPYVSKEESKAIGDALGIELVPARVAGYSTVGSACIATNKGFLAHYKASDEDISNIKDALKVEGDKGTVNTGTGFVAFGAVANSKGYVAGEATTAFELGRLEEALGLIK